MLSVVIVSAGKSRRYRQSQNTEKDTLRGNKTLELIGGIPVFIHSLQAFNDPAYNEIILTVSPEDYREETYPRILAAYPSLPNHQTLVSKLQIVPGGAERYHSVEQGLKHCSTDSKWVMIHDAARPLIHTEDLLRIRNAIETHIDDEVGILPVVPTTDTIKKVDGEGWVSGNLPRSMLRGATTPQCFPIRPLQFAYQKLKDLQNWKDNPATSSVEKAEPAGERAIPTDDSEVFFEAGHPVLTVPLQHPNPKLTTIDDHAYLTRLWERRL